MNDREALYLEIKKVTELLILINHHLEVIKLQFYKTRYTCLTIILDKLLM